MSLKDDFEKLKEKWAALTLGWKIILSIMMISQALSIASIGDSVFAFKGFIVQGIEFYHWVTDPIVAMLPKLISLTRKEFDACALLLLYYGSFFKMMIAHSDFEGDALRSVLSLILTGLCCVGVVVFAIHLGGASYVIAIVVAFICFSLSHILSEKILSSKLFQQSAAEHRSVLMYMSIPVIIVLFIAAISEGLFRPTT